MAHLSTLQQRCVEIYYDRKHLTQSLSGLDSIIDALGSFATGVVVTIFLFIVLLIFITSSIGFVVTRSCSYLCHRNISGHRTTLLSFGTLLVAISFSFGEAAKHYFESFIFLFVRHPYDIGDRVYIPGVDQGCYVTKLDLMTTTFTVGAQYVLFVAW